MPISLMMAMVAGAAVGVGLRRLIPVLEAVPWWLCAVVCSAAAVGGDLAVRAMNREAPSRLQELAMQVLFAVIGALAMGAAVRRRASADGRHDLSQR